MQERTCSVPGCTNPQKARGWCGAHWLRWRNHGDVQAHIPVLHPGRPVADRLWERVDKDGPSGVLGSCWTVTEGLGTNGYGYINEGRGRHHLTHRLAYELLIGPIPKGLTLDHLCHTVDKDCRGGDSCPHRACCNPAHLEPVTSIENVARGRGRNKAECGYGHAMTPDNVYSDPQGHKECRRCRRVQWLRFADRRARRVTS